MAKRKALAYWITGPGAGELREEVLPAPAAGELLVRSLYGAVSRGTESLVFAGRVPPSQVQAMRAPHQAGDFPAPVKYGYSNVGMVESGPETLLGRQVFCLYPHQDLYLVPAQAALPLPTALPPARAVLAAAMETALNGIWDSSAKAGDHIAVIGAGVIGCLVAWLAAREPETTVQLIDIDGSKAKIAGQLGLDFALPQEARGAADLVIHASGAPEGLVTALGLCRFEATILELSWYGDRLVALPLGEAFHAKRLTLRSSQVGSVAPARRADWDHRRRLAHALELLDDPRLDHLISGETPFAELPQTMAHLAETARGTLCHRIVY